jgi:hypothetical protein
MPLCALPLLPLIQLIHCLTMLLLAVACLSPRGLGFGARLLHVGSVLDKVELGIYRNHCNPGCDVTRKPSSVVTMAIQVRYSHSITDYHNHHHHHHPAKSPNSLLHLYNRCRPPFYCEPQQYTPLLSSLNFTSY